MISVFHGGWRFFAGAILLSGAALLAAGCARFADFAATRADRAAYGIIEQKDLAALGASLPFTIDRVMDPVTSGVLRTAQVDRLEDAVTTPTAFLSLNDALAVAVNNSREYLTRKEDLYRSALALTETRRDYGSVSLFGTLDGVWTHEVTGHGTDTGVVTEDSGSLTQSLGISIKKTLVTGAQVTIDATHAFTRYFITKDPDAGTNGLEFRIVQPLLDEAGSLVALEGLRQSERSMIYSVRTFERYRKGFVIDRISSYYGLLQERDRLSNAYNDYQSAMTNREWAEAWAKENRMAPIEADQARQRELTSRSRYVAEMATYLTQLDQFRMELGLPINLDFGPDPVELHRLFLMSRAGLPELSMAPKDAIELALARRLDLRTQEDRVDDAWRQVRIAFRRFLPSLDAFFEYTTEEDHGAPHMTLDFADHTYSGGFNFALPTNWTKRRNDYRRAQIEYERARRALDEKRDDVALEVLKAYRQLGRARLEYEIQRQSVALAERRVERAQIMQEEGEGTQRDLLEAQDDLLQARNDLTAAVISYTIQRLRFWNAIEGLEVNERGRWRAPDEADGENAAAGPPAQANAPMPEGATGEVKR